MKPNKVEVLMLMCFWGPEYKPLPRPSTLQSTKPKLLNGSFPK